MIKCLLYGHNVVRNITINSDTVIDHVVCTNCGQEDRLTIRRSEDGKETRTEETGYIVNDFGKPKRRRGYKPKPAVRNRIAEFYKREIDEQEDNPRSAE